MTSHTLDPGMQTPDIATPDEVLETFTHLMRSEKTSEQLKAAEQLAKYHSLFTPKEDASVKPEVIAEIEAAVQRLQATLPDAELPAGPPDDAASSP